MLLLYSVIEPVKKSILISKNLLIPIVSLCLILQGCSDDEPTANDDSPTFELSNFTPVEGLEGTELSLNGNNFGTSSDEVKVYVNNVEAEIQSVSNTKIEIIAPANNRGTNASIEVVINDKTNTFDGNFSYITHTITDFSPKKSVLHKDIIIYGENFSENIEDVRVFTQDSDLSIVSVSSNSIVVQTTSLGYVLEKYPISVEIGEYVATSGEDYTYGVQYKVNADAVNNNLKNGRAICPGSAINFNVNDNRDPNSSLQLNITPTFSFNGIESPEPFTWPADNRGRDIYIDIPTGISLGTATVKGSFDEIEFIPQESDEVLIGEGHFKLPSTPVFRGSVFEIELDNIFRVPENMIVVFTNTSDDTKEKIDVTGYSWKEEFTKTILKVVPPDEVGSWEVAVSTADSTYHLNADGSSILTTN